jgi:hypothetical protein
MERPMKKGKLPKSDFIHELAKFWDKHDLTDFEEELEEVTEPVFVRDTAIKVHLDAHDAAVVQQIAHAKGVSLEALIHGWVQQKLRRRNNAGASKR